MISARPNPRPRETDPSRALKLPPARARHQWGLYLIFLLVVLLPACNVPGEYWSFPLFPPPARLAAPKQVAAERVSPPPASTPVPNREPVELPKPLLPESGIREQQLVGERPLAPPSPLPSVTPPTEPAPAKSAAAGPELSEPPMQKSPAPEAPLSESPAPEPPPPEKAPEAATVLLKETTIKSKEELVFPPSPVEEPAAPAPGEQAVPEASPPEAEEPSLIELITPDTPPQRAASLRIAEEGRMLLQVRQYEKGLSRLEKAIAVDSRNRHAYYYLAEAHYRLAHHQQSLNFLEIIEPSLADEPKWLARIYALEGENLRALGFFERADRKFVQALALDPFNRVALEGLAYLPAEIIAPIR